MNSFDQKKYCGLIQNEIQKLTGVFGRATSTGQSLFFKANELPKLKPLGLSMTNCGNGFYILMVGKKSLKKLNLF